MTLPDDAWYDSAMKNPMKRDQFAPMLGPACAHPVETFDHAQRLGNEFEYTFNRVTDAIERMVPIL
jgi:hypothetical protein